MRVFRPTPYLPGALPRSPRFTGPTLSPPVYSRLSENRTSLAVRHFHPQLCQRARQNRDHQSPLVPLAFDLFPFAQRASKRNRNGSRSFDLAGHAPLPRSSCSPLLLPPSGPVFQRFPALLHGRQLIRPAKWRLLSCKSFPLIGCPAAARMNEPMLATSGSIGALAEADSIQSA